jgi:hypothetical protein
LPQLYSRCHRGPLGDGGATAYRAGMLARRFLYIFAFLIVLLLALGIGWSLMQDRLLRMAFVPSAQFAVMPDTTAPDYARASAWLARPDLPDDPAR